MPGNLQKLIKPTGLEAEQERAKTLRELADKLNENLGDTSPVGSWTQVLARIMQGFVAAREGKKADELNADVSTKMQNAFNSAHAGLVADVKSGMDPADIIANHGNDQYLADDPLFKAMNDSYVAGIKKRAEEMNTVEHTPTGWKWLPDIINQPEFNPESKLVPGADGRFHINLPLVGADLLAQGYKSKIPGALEGMTLPGSPSQIGGAGSIPPSPQPAPPTSGEMPFTPANIGAVESGNRDFLPSGQPVTSPKGAMYGMQVMPATAANPGYGVPPVPASIMGLPNTDPRKAAAFDKLGALYAQAMQRKFGALGPAAYNAGPGRVQSAGGNLSALPQETQSYAAKFAPPSMPTTSARPPDKVINGQPYWQVNGQWFDNAAGQ